MLFKNTMFLEEIMKKVRGIEWWLLQAYNEPS